MSSSVLSPSRQALLEERASFMRLHPTPSEALLWSALRGGRLGVSFRRQVVVGRYITDFACAKARLVVEVDGGYHGRRQAADARRDAALRKLGWRVLRVPGAVVERQPSLAVALVRAMLSAPLAA